MDRLLPLRHRGLTRSWPHLGWPAERPGKKIAVIAYGKLNLFRNKRTHAAHICNVRDDIAVLRKFFCTGLAVILFGIEKIYFI